MILNDNIILRAPEPSDVDAMFRWENDSASWNAGRTRAPMSRHALWEYVNNYSADIMAAGQARFVIVDGDSDEPVGCVDLYDIDILNRRGGVGIYIEKGFRRQGYAQQAIGLLSLYCQRELGLHQLWAVISADNKASRALFRSCNFKECGRLRSWIRHSEHYKDALIAQSLLV